VHVLGLDGVPHDWHLMHYGSRAVGGAGLLFTEMTCVAADARITHGCTGMYGDAHEAAWKRIVDFVHANSKAKICLQLGHAGRKGATRLMWEGMDEPLEDGTAGPSCPRRRCPISRTVAGAARADARRHGPRPRRLRALGERGRRAGFDMLELHMAHGYLLASFISPLTNRRKDKFGGPIENRMRWPLEVFRACREAWPRRSPCRCASPRPTGRRAGFRARTGGDAPGC
jgi:anthraniloyl-CoA monooxygenase